MAKNQIIITEPAKAYSSVTINNRPTVLDYHLALLFDSDSKFNTTQLCKNCFEKAIKTAPIFSKKVLNESKSKMFNQYELLCKVVATRDKQHFTELKIPNIFCIFNHNLWIFRNVNVSWSTFIYDFQKFGKNYMFFCFLENCLIPSKLRQLSSPFAVIVFHYDIFTFYESRQLCEATYLCFFDVPVKVLISPTNFWWMKQSYENLSLSSSSKWNPEVFSMKFQNKHLNVTRMMSMMAVNNKNGFILLYIEIWIKSNPFSWSLFL